MFFFAKEVFTTGQARFVWKFLALIIYLIVFTKIQKIYLSALCMKPGVLCVKRVYTLWKGKSD